MYKSIYEINNFSGLFTYLQNIYLPNDSFNNCIYKYKNHLKTKQIWKMIYLYNGMCIDILTALKSVRQCYVPQVNYLEI